VPVILVVKCGSPAEKDNPKPGNRGKRDSQIVLMGFFSRVLLNERMCPLDFDLFRKIHYLTGVTPDYFEGVLMVDADTKVLPDSLTLLTNAIINDTSIMGLCGETRIANKRTNWVTWIQVFEYFIAHHMGKSFEAIFGGVTCLPGCFCMYRLKTPGKNPGEWIPILTKPEIVEEYAQNTVHTLHQKNLLLLGEDRFLSTLMLRTFPHRKMMFVPQAMCKTTVPDEFKVLLSQRRRWINSTVHNLLELVLVRSLCGTFCFSMQFVVMMDIVGTVTLPIGIFLFYYLIFTMATTKFVRSTDYIPVVLLALILILPAILILLTTRKVVYCAWMLLYLAALPVWNFILPAYSYWHFDDFAWGDTRKVEGEKGGKGGHGSGEGTFNPNEIPMKRWEEYERAFRKSMHKKKQEKMAQQQRHHDGYGDDRGRYNEGRRNDYSPPDRRYNEHNDRRDDRRDDYRYHDQRGDPRGYDHYDSSSQYSGRY
jgi:chitin synthase